MSDLVKGLRRKAEAARSSAHTLLNAGDADGCVSRAYYPAFYMAMGALALVDEHPKTHSGAANRFWVRFVDEDRFSGSTAHVLHTALDARQRADYHWMSSYGPVEAAQLLEDVEAFLEAADALIQELQSSN